MVKWYVIGYLVTGVFLNFIAMIIAYINNDLVDVDTKIGILLAWPFVILVTVFFAIDQFLETLAIKLVEKFKERTKHE